MLVRAQGLLLLLPPSQKALSVLAAREGVSSEGQGAVPTDPRGLAARAKGRGKGGSGPASPDRPALWKGLPSERHTPVRLSG